MTQQDSEEGGCTIEQFRWMRDTDSDIYKKVGGRRTRLPPTVCAQEQRLEQLCYSFLSRLGHRTANESTAEGHRGVIMWLIDNYGGEEEEEKYYWGTKAPLNKPQQTSEEEALVSEPRWWFIDFAAACYCNHELTADEMILEKDDCRQGRGCIEEPHCY